ncbi:MAG: VCBS repeat-containing protein [Candidatus Omnitrophica bacterium]|nr:VCBS repeat-containing protein [Candidatus Omnitrophota bacterium]MBU4478973.1 VCBS repeat-containing protein [Candidatus Omnitrophota bacterium]MCG2703754.1 FG-GAP-like repeat-containing protein [Candidatus Omnitrophota bacterium]
MFEDTLGSLDVSGFSDGVWTLRITVTDNLAQSRQNSVNFTLDRALQTGWPQIMRYGTYHSSPVTGDIDNDGDLEIVIGSYAGIVYAWHHDGTLVSGWPQYMEGDSRSTPALADLDGDGYMEVVCCAATSYHPNVYVWRHDGTPFPGWPKKVGNYISTAPVVEDIDNDGDFEIIFPAEDWRVYAYHHDGILVNGWPVRINRSQQGAKVVVGDIDHDGYKEIFSSDVNSVGATVYVWRYNGMVLPGWPKTWTEPYLEIYPTAIADVNGDANPEIIAGGEKLHVWSGTGSLISGWPKELFDENNYRVTFMYPVIADIDNNGIPDILSVDANNTIHAWSGNGTYLSGWPVTFGYYNPAWTYYPVLADIDGDSYPEILVNAYDSYYGMENICVFNHDGTSAQGWPKSGVEHTSAPAVEDLDRDGDVEIIAVGSYEGKPEVNMYVWDLPGTYRQSKMEWPLYAHDSRNTGGYVAEQARGTISGTVTLQGRQNHSGIIIIELRNPGEAVPLETYYVAAAVDGSYLLEDLPLGTHDVTAKASNCLRLKNSNITISNGQTTADVDFFLLGGDANNDNYVAWLDYGILRNAYNTQAGDPRWDSRADFNADGFIAWQDYSILRANYGKAGE